MKRTLSILGSTGSIGRKTLDSAQAARHQQASLTVDRPAVLAPDEASRPGGKPPRRAGRAAAPAVPASSGGSGG